MLLLFAPREVVWRPLRILVARTGASRICKVRRHGAYTGRNEKNND
ncbi:hypothetical protein C4K37_0383 [Pseudomonas chlororaphis subsp. piscium]|nr:hypothetical protein C4K37_0383 [Pseudomonas chlororaphis subsp. piscium]AZC41338.1 hypothetical protein C4K36_0384 [Pseudomonas chlororaphis subsp. piscium]AZC48006.1 hypothetical protein C4K35_0394 [Pseudomonas chlororaphis subsp. piscium]AZC54585.1 hypothetical protein C4K34_0391 [Pseudomonas chlororaphis subsp. piscium]AZC60905.1 hypothetical protein C4K33_0384 [Pseudomonas chlororaphis subsp. piscium]